MRAAVTITGSAPGGGAEVRVEISTDDDRHDGFIVLEVEDETRPAAQRVKVRLDPTLVREAISSVLATRRSFARAEAGMPS